MNILLISPIYPSEDQSKQTTPVVHYFAREWVKMGHSVKVINVPTNFPKWIYLVLKPFVSRISNKVGFPVRDKSLTNTIYLIDEVEVLRFPMRKTKPHGKFSQKEVKRITDLIVTQCKKEDFTPDIIIGHWILPSLDLIVKLKDFFGSKSCLVLHSNGNELSTIYKKEAEKWMNKIDVLGFRSWPIRMSFEKKFSYSKLSFMAFSGIPQSGIDQVINIEKDFSNINKILFVGQLIGRKYPVTLLEAVKESFKDTTFELSFIGMGAEEERIKVLSESFLSNQKVELLGQIPREEVFHKMGEAQIFVMISRNEVYGLVYLEAMAAGCITIASRNEGFDGIIRHGENGFLCEAGNEQELTELLTQIRQMPPEQLKLISDNARKTAIEMTDVKCAENYLKAVLSN